MREPDKTVIIYHLVYEVEKVMVNRSIYIAKKRVFTKNVSQRVSIKVEIHIALEQKGSDMNEIALLSLHTLSGIDALNVCMGHNLVTGAQDSEGSLY